MSSSSHEDVFDSDSDTERQLTGQGRSKGESHGQVSYDVESKGNKTPTPEHWWPGISKAKKSFASSEQTAEGDLIQLSPVEEKQTVQITTEDFKKVKELSSDLQQQVGSQDFVSGGNKDSVVQTPASCLANGSVANNLNIANDSDRSNGNVGEQSSHSFSDMTQQALIKSQSGNMKSISNKREGSSSSIMKNNSSSSKVNLQEDSKEKEDHPFTDPKEECKENINQMQISETLGQGDMSFQLQHADASSCGTSTTNVGSKSAKQLDETPLSNTELLASAHQPTSISANSTENLLMKVIQCTNF